MNSKEPETNFEKIFGENLKEIENIEKRFRENMKKRNIPGDPTLYYILMMVMDNKYKKIIASSDMGMAPVT